MTIVDNTWKCYGCCFLYWVSNIYFFFWFHRSVGFEGNIKYSKKVLRKLRNAYINALTLQLSLPLCDNWRSCLVCRFILAEAKNETGSDCPRFPMSCENGWHQGTRIQAIKFDKLCRASRLWHSSDSMIWETKAVTIAPDVHYLSVSPTLA